MVVIGVDAHKRTHTFGVVDEVGRELANRTLPATLDGTALRLGGLERSGSSPWRTAVISLAGWRPT